MKTYYRSKRREAEFDELYFSVIANPLLNTYDKTLTLEIEVEFLHRINKGIETNILPVVV